MTKSYLGSYFCEVQAAVIYHAYFKLNFELNLIEAKLKLPKTKNMRSLKAEHLTCFSEVSRQDSNYFIGCCLSLIYKKVSSQLSQHKNTICIFHFSSSRSRHKTNLGIRWISKNDGNRWCRIRRDTPPPPEGAAQ